jgi:trk system potassium uptake protein TrkA
MSIHQNYGVFGLGRYGSSVAKELVRSGADVLAIDYNEAVVNAAVADLPICKCADVTDPEVIKNLDIGSLDVVVIAMAESLESSVMAAMLCKEAGVPTVIVKCANEMHGRILTRVGADQVVIPEFESGARLAKNLVSAGFVDMLELSEELSLLEMNVRPEWVGKSLIELDLRKKYAVNVVAIRCGDTVSAEIDPRQPLEDQMKLITIADAGKLKKIK